MNKLNSAINKNLKMLKINGRIHHNFYKFLSFHCTANFISGIQSVLSTHSMLGALNIGSNNEVVNDLVVVSVNLIGKDIIGQLASIPIVDRVAKIGDNDTVKYLRMNVLIYEISNFIECLTPLFNIQYFIYLGALGNIGKNIGFTGFGSFNAKMINSISLDKDNICELYSKISIANTVSYSFGMISGLFIVKIIPCHYTRLSLLPALGFIKYKLLIKSMQSIEK